MPLGVLILLEYFDNSIKTPERIREFTNLYLAGGFPLVTSKVSEEEEELHMRLVNQMSNYINYVFYNCEEKKHPFVVLFFSTREQEGKSQLASLVAKDMRATGETTLVIRPKTNGESKLLLEDDDEDNIEYDQPNNYSDVVLSDRRISGNKKSKDYRFVFFEIPAIIGSDLPIKIMSMAHLSLLIVRSNRGWNEADNMALESYSKIVDHKMSSIINGAHPDVLETIIGEIPKKRSWLRTKVKQLLKLQFKNVKF